MRLREHWAYLLEAGRYPGVDAVRAAAILLVVAYHLRWLSSGWLGVDLFFVLSGFLVGGSVYDGVRSGRFSFATFYRNRFLRILPLYYVVLLGGAAAKLATWATTPSKTVTARTLAAAALFLHSTGPYFFGWDLSPGLAPGGSWSLVIEEYFYLLFPLAAVVLGPRRLPWALGLAFAAAPVVRWLATRGFDPHDANWFYASFVQFHSRYDEILAGALASVAFRKWGSLRAFGVLSAVLLVVAVTEKGWVPQALTAQTLWLPTVAAFAFAVALLAVAEVPAAPAPIVLVARLSYPLYLVHCTAMELTGVPTTVPGQMAFVASCAAISYVLSLLVEYPALRRYRSVAKRSPRIPAVVPPEPSI